MIKIERTFTINRPVEEVFAYLSVVEHGPRYIAGQREAHMTSTGPMGKGTTFATSGSFLHRSSTCEVTDYEADRRLTWVTTSGARATTSWDFQQAGHGTRVAFMYRRQPGGYGRLRLPEWLQQEHANERVDRDLWTLKELLAPSTAEAKAWSYQARTPAERGTILVPVAAPLVEGVVAKPNPKDKMTSRAINAPVPF